MQLRAFFFIKNGVQFFDIDDNRTLASGRVMSVEAGVTHLA